MATQRFMHGPWHFAGSGIIANDDDEEIGLSAVYDDDPNGKLIIAAPDLCAVAARIVEIAAKPRASIAEWDAAFDAARAALKKAGAL